MKIKYVCKQCGSDHVGRDAFCDWNVNTQQWEIANLMDNDFCFECLRDTDLQEIQIEGEEP